MKRSFYSIILFLSFTLCLASTAMAAINEDPACDVVPGTYIVIFEDERLSSGGLTGGREPSEKQIHSMASELAVSYGGTVRHVYTAAVRGYSAVGMTEEQARDLSEDPRVKSVDTDCYLVRRAIQTNAPWPLDRIDQRDLPLDGNFEYGPDGTGVHVYIIDTGIRTTHTEFAGRVGNGVSVVGGGVEDCVGHGTSVASNAVGSVFGVAKGATVHPVKVDDCAVPGTVGSIIAGVDWVTANHQSPAVANMSVGVDFLSTPMLEAVRTSIQSGVFYASAAGNTSFNACRLSPGFLPEIFNVGALTQGDNIAGFSSIGPCVDLFAPGVNNPVATIASNTSSGTSSGTSFSSPLAAGLGAVLLQGAPGASPSDVFAAILVEATEGRIGNIGFNSPDRILYSGFLNPSDPSPTADFSFSCSGQTCSFDGRLSTDNQPIASYSWNFGDGTSGSGATTSHTYATASSFSVTLTVTDSIGQTDSRTRTVTIGDDPPNAAFTVSCSVQTCSFNAGASSDDFGITSYSWAFGDGTSGSGVTTSHTYSGSGPFAVVLTVTDTAGQTDTATQSVSLCNDSILPSVSITAPANGAFIWGNAVVSANASDNSGISKVEFRVNNSLKCTDTSAPYSCTINVNTLYTGDATLKVKAFDLCGNTRQVTRDVFLVRGPVPILDAPVAGATVTGNNVRLSGWATDPDGVASIRFELDGQPLPLVGAVTYGLSRPDVCNAIPVSDPNCPNVGFEAFFDSELFPNGTYDLQMIATDTVGQESTVPTPARSITIDNPPQTTPCVEDANSLCLMGDRFKVTASFVNGGTSSMALARPHTDWSGTFYFFNSQNLEIGVKVLDGTSINGHYWVYHGTATGLAYTLTVTDTQTGDVEVYQKAAGSACGNADTTAFPGTQALSAPVNADDLSGAAIEGLIPIEVTQHLGVTEGTCTANSNTLCLLNNRYKVQVTRNGSLQSAQSMTSLSGAFWFFSSLNMEVLVKVLDGTGVNGKIWVFYGALTDQAFDLTVTDTVTGIAKTYSNGGGNLCGVQDTSAF